MTHKALTYTPAHIFFILNIACAHNYYERAIGNKNIPQSILKEQNITLSRKNKLSFQKDTDKTFNSLCETEIQATLL